MRRDEAIAILKEDQARLKTEFFVQSLSIFGSVARDEAGPKSDIDLLVEFTRPVGLFAFIGLQLYLEKLLSCRVDLATPDALRESMREQILSEAVRAA